MAYPIYLVKTQYPSIGPLFPHASAIVVAKSLTQAKMLISAWVPNGSSNLWQNATYNDLTTITTASQIPNLVGWTFTVGLNTASNSTVTYVGANQDTVASVGAALAALLVASPAALTASFASNVLTVATVGNGVGTDTLSYTITPPSTLFPSSYTWVTSDIVAATVDRGSAASAVYITFASTFVPPQVFQGAGISGPFAPLPFT
jgi:hypothetical protein